MNGAGMEWGDLRVFLAVAREGTLGAAARKLGQSQPTMGRRLRELEEALGQTLFQRSNDGFVLTDEGSTVLAHAERIEEEVTALGRELAGQDQKLDGLLRVSSSDWFGAYLLAPVLSDFAKDERPWVEGLREAIADNAGLLATDRDSTFQNKVHLAMQAKGFFDKEDSGDTG